MSVERRPRVEAYTDGSCRPNPGPGSWAVLLRSQGHERTLSGTAAETTNNRMELTAAIEALNALKRPCQVELYTDSNYVRQGIETWLAHWRARPWRTADGKPVANVDLWQALEQAQAPHRVRWHWVRGHSGHPENERVDALARQAWQARFGAGEGS